MARSDRLLQLLLKLGRRKIAQAVAGRVDVGDVARQDGVPRLGKVDDLSQGGNRCRAEQIGNHPCDPSTAAANGPNATGVPLAAGGATAPRAAARPMAINSAAGGNWAKR